MSAVSRSKIKKKSKNKDYIEATREKIENWDFSLASGLALKVLLQTQSLTHSLTHSLIHSFTHSLTH